MRVAATARQTLSPSEPVTGGSRGIGGLSTALHPDTGAATIFVHDGMAGGAGFARRGYAVAEELPFLAINFLVPVAVVFALRKRIGRRQ